MSSSPANFSWIDDLIAGSAKPVTVEEIEFYIKKGISHLVSLTVDKPLAVIYFEKDNNGLIQFHHLATYSTISENNIHKFREIIKEAQLKNEKVVVHCQFGQERTGMLLAIYLIEFKGFKRDKAIKFIQENRPGSLRTSLALEFLRDRYK